MANLTTILKRDTAGRVVTGGIADGAVTAEKLAPGAVVIPAAIPVGAIMPFAQNEVPTGWLAANGAAISRTTYADLFAVIGETYGDGNNSTTFELPDLRGYFERGSGTNADTTASGTFGQKQTAYAGYNTYSATIGADDRRSLPYDKNLNFITINSQKVGIDNIGPYNIPVTPGDTRPKNIAMLYCIKF